MREINELDYQQQFGKETNCDFAKYVIIEHLPIVFIKNRYDPTLEQ